MKRVVGLVALLLLLVPIVSFSQSREEKEKKAVELVNKAIDYIQKNGEKAFKVMSTKKSPFIDGELYVFVYDENLTMVAHPFKPYLVGINLKGKPDAKGNFFRDEMKKKALAGGGWVTYYYKKPGAQGLHRKKTYCKMAEVNGKKYIVCCGVYLD